MAAAARTRTQPAVAKTQRGRPLRVDDAERQAIADALRAGESINAVAKRIGRSTHTVMVIGREAGVNSTCVAMQNATAARLTRSQAAAKFNEARQLDLLSRLADAVEARLDNERPLTPLEAQQAATAVAITIDKWRLIEGEATARTEVASQGARDRLAARLDELAERRKTAETVRSQVG